MKSLLLGSLALALLTSPGVMSFEARVLELSDRFLDFKNEGMWLVKFYAPWCGHCKRLEPIFNHVAQALYDSPIRVGKVDCTRFPTVCSTFRVSGFPTIMFIHGHSHIYQGDRKTEDIVRYARRMSGPAVKDLTYSCKDTDCAFKDAEIVFAYVGIPEGLLWEAFNATAYQYQSLNVFYIFTKDQAPAHWIENHEVPFVAVKKEADEDFFTSPTSDSDPFDELSPNPELNLTSTLTKWVERERFPTFVEISRGNFQNLLDTKKFIVMAVLDQDKLGGITPEMTAFKTLVHSVVLKNKGKYHQLFQFGWVGTPSLANSIAMQTLPIPSLFILNASTFHHHIPQDEAQHLTLEAIETFIENILNEAAPVYGGLSLGTKIYRAYYEGKTNLGEMWTGNPILTTVIFGLPLAFLSLIFYSICCADFMDASEEEEETPPSSHEKRD